MMPEGVDRTEEVSEAALSDAEESGAVRVDETRRALPLVAVVGRPNVGKSTLFNRLTGERRSIVGDEPGITRDRIYGQTEWNGRRFALVDTGGIVPDDDAVIPSNILKQAAAAIEEAAALVWVVDVRKGVTPLDEELARLLRLTGKRVLVAANKADAERLETDAGEFYRFGFEEVFPVSAEHGNGLGDLLDSLTEGLEAFTEVEEKEGTAREIRLAIIGRPNVGKSSLLNRLLGEERVIVSPVAGTTRDAVDTVLEVGGQSFRLIDTAGIRRKGKTEEMAEKMSVLMARRSLERADVAIVVIDAADGVAALDANIAGYAHDAGCSIIIAVNKWDAVPDKETGTPAAFERALRDKMKFLDWAPVITISALTGQRVERLLPVVLRANEARNRRIPTSQLNDFFERAVAQPRGGGAPAPVKGGVSRLHIQYMTQVGVRPPTFVVFTAGGRAGLHFSYERYLQNRLREEFDFFATPLRIVERHRKKNRG
ncbi:MAG TPA: ribosome biogenesis GTPase Der [Pyrinomonadaceae bacterium]|jgi:GTP-binding protein|nr:ribosome biogenesis GTPase Der [Pyrinomonadaceae bacterium]